MQAPPTNVNNFARCTFTCGLVKLRNPKNYSQTNWQSCKKWRRCILIISTACNHWRGNNKFKCYKHVATEMC